MSIRFGAGGLGLPGEAAVAGGVHVPSLRWPDGVDNNPPPVRVRQLPAPGLGDRRDDLPGSAETVDALVPGDVVDHGAEAWGQCPGAAARVGPGQLRDRVDLVAQAPARDGPAWARSLAGPRGARRAVCRRHRRGRARTTDRDK